MALSSPIVKWTLKHFLKLSWPFDFGPNHKLCRGKLKNKILVLSEIGIIHNFGRNGWTQRTFQRSVRRIIGQRRLRTTTPASIGRSISANNVRSKPLLGANQGDQRAMDVQGLPLSSRTVFPALRNRERCVSRPPILFFFWVMMKSRKWKGNWKYKNWFFF